MPVNASLQLRDTSVQVIELAPPLVATNLQPGQLATPAMPLAEFIAEEMSILRANPSTAETCVERVKM